MLPTPPPDIAPWLYFSCISAAVLILGIAKAGFGGGIGILAVPLMAVAIPTEQTIGIILPLLIFADIFSVAAHRKSESKPHLRWMLTGCVLGIVAGTLVLIWVRQTTSFNLFLNLTIGITCLFFVAVQVYRLMGGHVPHISPRPIAGRIVGFSAGLASTLTHAAGPIINVYLLEQRLNKKLLVGTAVMFAFAGNLMKLPTYLALALINPATMMQSLWCMPLIPVGTMLGVWMHKRVPEKAFTIIMYCGAAAAAGNMLYKSLF